jgi:tripartite-type tricarboxylate transporter receptor subunit TctC
VSGTAHFDPGGPSDTIARIMAEHMRVSLGQPIILENVAGAAGSIGAGRVARAAGDGHTLVIGVWGTHVVNGAIYALQYDLLKDFEPISLLASNPMVIVAKKAMPARNLMELISWLKANPDKATAGTTGTGGASHVAAIFFQRETGTRFQFVPYRGLAPAMQDLVAGQIDGRGRVLRAGARRARHATLCRHWIIILSAAHESAPTAGRMRSESGSANSWMTQL